MTVDPHLAGVATTIGTAMRSGMPVGFAQILSGCHGMP